MEFEELIGSFGYGRLLAGVSICPRCQEEFPGESFCPHDGTPLASDDRPTVLEDPSLPSAVSGKDLSAAFSRRLHPSSDALVTEGVANSRTIAGSPTAPSAGTPSTDTPLAGTTPSPSSSPASKILKALMDNRPERLLGIELEGRYKIERQIGEGGMGVVYLARHSVIEKLVAVKVLRSEVASSESVVKRFVQEARAASKIGHPNIIDVTDFGTTDEGLTYQVMEYLQGKTLARLLRDEGVLSVERTMHIVSQVALALQAAHDKGIVHRDLKPENIFLIKRNDSEDFVKIVDFGIAKVVSDVDDDDAPRLTRVGTVIGTPEYMAPEQAAGRPDVDSRADIYALGIIVYEMLSGKVALQGNSTVRTLAMQMLDVPVDLMELSSAREVTEELNEAVMKALAKKPTRRFQRMEEFLEALRRATNFTQIDLPLVVQAQLEAEEAQTDTIPEAGLAQVSLAATRQVNKQESKAPSPRRVKPATEGPSMGMPSATRMAMVEQALAEESEAKGASNDSSHQLRGEKFVESKSPALIVGLTLLIVAGGVSAYALTRDKKTIPDETQVAKVTEKKSDGTLPVGQQGDKNLVVPSLDAGVTAITGVSDSGTEAGKTVEIRVQSSPRGARLLAVVDGDSKRSRIGTSSALMQAELGQKISVSCKKAGYEDGSVVLHFDGEKKEYTCRLRKSTDNLSRCVPGVKNPFNPACD